MKIMLALIVLALDGKPVQVLAPMKSMQECRVMAHAAMSRPYVDLAVCTRVRSA